MITRENYEEFFLLYLDDELPVTARAAVERFVADNPDLREEWETLLQCRVQPDQDHDFRDKDALLHYEASLLSYVDGELDEHERQKVEEMVRQHPRAAEELHQLQMVVSHPDPSIVFPDKESLYAGRRRRAILLPWLRAGVAAAVLGSVGLLLFPRQHPREPIAVAPKNISPAVTSPAPTALYPTVKDEQVQVVTTAKDNGRQRKESAPSHYRQKVTLGADHLMSALAGDKPPARPWAGDESPARQKGRPAGAVPIRSPQPLVAMTTRTPGTPAIDTSSRSVRTAVAVADPQPVKDQRSSVAVVAVVNIPREQSSFATQALLRQAEEDSTINSIAELSAAPSKNKLRGIFRKVGRAFGKTADRDSDGQRQVLISAFQVALK